MFTRLLKASVLLLLSGCLSPIDFNLEGQTKSFAISGQVSTIPHRNLVQVSQTNGPYVRPLPVKDAFVTLHDDLGTSWQYQPTETPGTYSLPDYSGTPGRVYHIEVLIPDGGFYSSKPERMPLATPKVTTYYEFEERPYVDFDGFIVNNKFINVLTKPEVPSTTEPLYMKWTVNDIYMILPTDFPDIFGHVPPPCYIAGAPDPQRIVLYNGLDDAVAPDETLLLATRVIDKSFHTRHYFITYLSSITPEAHEYWRKVSVLVEQVGSIFDTPPAEITGNIQKSDAATPRVF
jgi:hypothetical protein